MSARIDPPGRDPWWARFAFRYLERKTGKVPSPLHIAARSPRLLFATIVYEWAISKTPSVQARLKMLAGLRATTLVGCPF